MRAAVWGVAVGLCLWLGAATADAQSAVSGALGGVVADASGAAVPAASVEVTDAAVGFHRTLAADALGEFLLGDLPPGTYQLSIRARGFAAVRVPDVVVALGQTVRLAPVLPVASVAQRIDVSGADALPGFDAPVNADLSPEAVRVLPLDGRRFQGLAVLTPLAGAEAAGDADYARLAVRGLDPMQNRYALDGLSLTRALDGAPRGGDEVPFTLPLEAVREFQVRAVHAEAAGGVVNTVTRGGERQVHGSAFLQFRDSGVGAANPYAMATTYHDGSPLTVAVKPADRRLQFGGSVGGAAPRTKQRVLGFVAAEGQRRSFPGISSPSDPSFYQLSAVQTALLANRGVGAAQSAAALRFLDSLAGPVDRRADEFALFPRVDWQASAKASAWVEWAHVRLRSPSGRHGEPVVNRGRASFGDLVTHADSVSLHGSLALGTRWLETLHAQYSRDASYAGVSAPLAQEPQTGPGGAAPQVSIAGAFVFGDAASLGSRREPDERRTEMSEELRFSGRAHTVRMGLSASGVDERIGSRGASSGAYDYTSGMTGGHAGGLVDFITDYTYSSQSYPNGGCPSVFAAVHFFCFASFTQSFAAAPETRFHTVEWSAFAQDAWRVTPRLRLTLGARHEYVRLPPVQHANAALDAVFGDFAATGNMPRDTNNLAPSAGIAYALSKGTMARLGYGVSFGRVPGRTLQAALEDTAQASSATQLRLTPRTIVDPACASAGTNFGYPATYTCAPFGSVVTTSAAMMFARGFQAPMVQTAELSVTRELRRGTSVSASYVMALERQLQNTTDLNIAPSTGVVAFRIVRDGGEAGARGGEVFHVPLYAARRTSAAGPVTGILSNGNGTYHALAMQVEHRAGRTLTASVHWTYSKALDTVVNGGATPNQNSAFDPYEPLYDRAPSNFDRTHRVVASAIWQPVWHGGAWSKKLWNGWAVSPLFVASTGRPYSYEIADGTALAGGRESLNGSGGARYLPSVGRNTLRLPWIENLDARVTRAVVVHERLTAKLTAEAFNVLNHVNPTAVEQRAFLLGAADGNGVIPMQFQDAAAIAAEGVSTRPFGTVTSSADSPVRERRLQFGLRLEW